MRVSPASVRLPVKRVLLAQTRLAYVHIQNMLTDAKRDRAARVFGYVAVWLPEEMILLYLQEGEVVAATMSRDGRAFEDVAIRDALARVPNAAEYGEICFHEADDEQLACMHAAQTRPPDPFSSDVRLENAAALLGHLSGATYDGMLEINAGGRLNYVVFRDGAPRRGYFADTMATNTSVDDAFRRLWTAGAPPPGIRRWAVPPALPNQAPPALIDAYRGLMRGLVERLTREGVTSAVHLAERARQTMATTYPALRSLDFNAVANKDPVTAAPALTRAVASWGNDILWAAPLPDGVTPEQILRDLTRERRHLFQSAGLFDALAWKIV